MTAEAQAQVLSGAMPFLRQLAGKTIVIKYGGNAMTDAALKADFARDVVLLRQLGLNPVVVHGGGPQIDAMLTRVGKQGEFVQGMRVTDAETMAVVEMVLGGQVNKEIVALINQAGGRAVGLTGKDGNLIRARALTLRDEHGQPLSIGQVGEVVRIDPRLIEVLTDADYIPVVAPIGVGTEGEAFNINADLVAGCLAQTLRAAKLMLLTNTPGVLDRQGNLLPALSGAQIQALFADGTLYGGMIPKITSALAAAENGVGAVHILDGRVPHVLLLDLLTDQQVGTMIHAS